DKLLMGIPSAACVHCRSLSTLETAVNSYFICPTPLRPLYNEQWSNLMVGNEARFTDSSDDEKRDFKKAMTFTHPVTGQEVFCSWHGKIQTPLYRIHVEWPMPEKVNDVYQPLLVAYIGPKLTKR
ncbi:MAG: hypothetical protein O2960_23995, partial [Verrucomicrobia bacterium]|nr:hypothetical protein [Verrucomicrobiota bacterium]